MQITMMKSKIHRATIREANLNYVGSITIDENLMQAANLREYEQVQVLNCNNGKRFETYVIRGVPGSGMICVNGAAARCALPGDIVIIIAYAHMTPAEADQFQPTVVQVDAHNQVAAL